MDAQSQKNPNSHRAHISEAATELLDEGMKFANEMYADGLKKADDLQQNAKNYSDDLLEKVREHPLKAVLIAGGIGMLLSALLRK